MANIVIGTTPTHTFTVDVDLRDAVEIWISYAQKSKIILNKTLADGIEVTENSLVVRLTQQDTLAFIQTSPVKIQIRAKYGDGSAIKSMVINTTSDECLKRGVI